MAPTLLSPILGDLARRARGVGMDQRREAVLLQEVAALRQRLDVALDRLDRLQRGAGQRHQAMLDPLEMLGDDLELGVRQQAVQVGDAAGDRVLDRDDGQLRLAGLDRGHGGLEGRARQGRHVGKGRAAGHVGVGARLALEGDGVAGLAAALAAPARLLAPELAPSAIVGGCFARRITPVNRRAAPKSEKPRKIRDLRRSAARARGRDRILLAALRACYSNVRKIWALRDLTMASFNTVAGCVLASALFAMVVGKVSNALVHPHKLDKPAIAVVRRSAADSRPLPRRRRSCRRSGPSSPAPMSRRARRSSMKQCFTCHTDRQGRRQQGRPQPVGHRRPQEGEPRGLQLLLGPAGQGRRLDLRRHQPHDLQAARLT